DHAGRKRPGSGEPKRFVTPAPAKRVADDASEERTQNSPQDQAVIADGHRRSGSGHEPGPSYRIEPHDGPMAVLRQQNAERPAHDGPAHREITPHPTAL